MKGKVLIGGLLGFAVIFGAALWYFQTYAYYERVQLAPPQAPQIEAAQPVAVAAPVGQAVLPADTADVGQPPVPGSLDAPGATDGAALDTGVTDRPAATITPPETTTPATDAAPDAEAAIDGATPASPDAATTPAIAAPDTDIDVAALPGLVSIRLTRVMDNLPEPMLAEAFEGIDAPTSPLKFKACFRAGNSIPMLTETYVIYDNATPLKAPAWFSCYRHREITDALDTGGAVAFLGEANIQYGVDRVIAVFDDGRAFAWHQLNQCGQAAFSGVDLPDGCPPKPER
ncbi:MAG: hypothetical protein KDK00_15340 [Rhodobacteraceae bacterium]|nr:hypothetical protein [Paracoccaceae bacterium]